MRAFTYKLTIIRNKKILTASQVPIHVFINNLKEILKQSRCVVNLIQTKVPAFCTGSIFIVIPYVVMHVYENACIYNDIIIRNNSYTCVFLHVTNMLLKCALLNYLDH